MLGGRCEGVVLGGRDVRGWCWRERCEGVVLGGRCEGVVLGGRDVRGWCWEGDVRVVLGGRGGIGRERCEGWCWEGEM